jgi:hypothetical protein
LARGLGQRARWAGDHHSGVVEAAGHVEQDAFGTAEDAAVADKEKGGHRASVHTTHNVAGV